MTSFPSWKNVPLNAEVNRVCDIHFIEARMRKMTEVPHCINWDKVPHVLVQGVLVMDCPIDKNGSTCKVENRSRDCNLKYWEDRFYGESLWPIPPYDFP